MLKGFFEGLLHCTGSIKRFSVNENFRKILKVSHFYLGFSPNKNNIEIKHFQWVSLEFSDSDLGNSNETLYEPETLMKLCGNI